jgi:hypothetical protein
MCVGRLCGVDVSWVAVWGGCMVRWVCGVGLVQDGCVGCMWDSAGSGGVDVCAVGLLNMWVW